MKIAESYSSNIFQFQFAKKYYVKKLLVEYKMKKILCVDDDVLNLEAISILLTNWNYQTKTASSINEVEAVVESQFSPDLLIVDYHLDYNKTGLDFVRRYFNSNGTTLPVLIITADYSTKINDLIRSSGYSILYKPLNLIRLKNKINFILSE